MKRLKFEDKKEIKELLYNDKVIAFPTETVFGLGVISSSLNAFNRLVEVKRRSPDKPFTLMCSSVEQINKYAEIDDVSKKLIFKYMPGSITLLLRAKKNIPSYITLESEFIGVRIPDLKGLIDLIEYVGTPLLVPSCNKANDAPALSVDEVESYFTSDEVACVVEGNCTTKLPSTIIKVDNGEIVLIRRGPISIEEIKEYLKEN